MLFNKPAPWISNEHLLGVGVSVTALLVLVATQASFPRYEKQYAGVPIPFLAGSARLTADIDFYGTRNGIDVYEVTFPSGVLSEWMLPDRIHLVHIPNSSNVPTQALDDVVTSISGIRGDVDYFGYKYVTSDAVFEITARHDPDFADRFPGHFFASQVARDEADRRGEPLSLFEAANGITFHPTDGTYTNANMIPDSLWVIVVNQPGGARLAPLVSPTCGNGIVDSGEECDDGAQNGTDGSTCNAQCYYKIPIPPIVGSSSSSFSSTPSSSASSVSSAISSSFSSSFSSSSSTTSSATSSSSSSSMQQCGGSMGLSCPTGERCEDDPTDGCVPGVSLNCPGFCVVNSCGDGIHDPPVEECDDANKNHTDSCNNYCLLIDEPF